ncbi:hypothetical protein H0H93_004480 [Arthromyces matolae]|nr:hypothetical protein H0H93_004480 [Arthromyces matolae]
MSRQQPQTPIFHLTGPPSHEKRLQVDTLLYIQPPCLFSGTDFRPPNAIEAREGGEICVGFDDNLQTVQMRSSAGTSGPEKDGFTFDRVFPMGTKQFEVFDYGVKDIVKDVLDGYNGTVFAYGQTGSGKTFTMMGADIDSDDLKGIIPRITEQIFQSIVESDAHLEYLVKVSYMEIYLERIRDLLAPHWLVIAQNDNLQVHEEKSKGVYVKGLSDYYVSSAREVYEIMRTGGAARIVSSTNMNAESSRSHSIFLITIQQRNTESGALKTGNLYLVDLAGSEKVGKTGASGQTLEEAKKINKSLSALGMVINALTDGKAKHIPYRDSKLTRILQESLGGNSRTTLIINCSPSSYNEAETLSTLRFGIRAKSIKNTARVNAELSPLELKGLLTKANLANTGYQKYISAVEAELAIWRSGGSVEESEWVTSTKVTAPSASLKKPPTSPIPSTPLSTSRSMTPVNPAIESLRGDLESRPQTPTVLGLEKDEREEFLRRENELSDQLAEKEAALATAEKLVKELKDELAFLKEQEASVSTENKTMSTHLNELRLQVERLSYDNKEGSITIDILKEQNSDAKNELEELKKQVLDLKSTQKDATAEDKEKRKQEKMAIMMAKFDNVCFLLLVLTFTSLTPLIFLADIQQGAFSEKDEQLRQILIKLDSIDSAESLTTDDLTSIRRQLSESQGIIRETVDRLRQSQEENEIATRRRDELEARVAALETEYEELLEKTIHDEETSDVDLAESMAELKAKLESQYAAKRDAHQSEVSDLKQQLELKGNEVRSLNASIDSLKSVNEELKRAFAVTSAGIEGGKNLAESAQDLERTRKAITVQLAEFDGVKKSLMRDLQNRCEKVVELEIQLDEMKEQYNNVIRNSNSKAQQKKMAFLERNLEQLTVVQKQLVDQNSSLKKEAGIAERKLLARNERIQNLEALLQDADRRLSIQNQKFEAQLQAVKERLDQARAQKAVTGSTLSFGRIAKPLRGGGGAAGPAVATTGMSPATMGGGVGVGNSAIARLQNDEGFLFENTSCTQSTLRMYGNLSVAKPFTGDWTTMTNWPSNPPTRNTSVSSAASGIELDSSFRVPYGSTPRSTNGNWDDATDLQSQKGSIKETHLHTARVLDRQATVTQATPFTTSRIDERSGTPTSGQFSPDAPRFVPVPSPTRQTFTVTVSHPDTATSHHSLQIPSTVNDVVPLSSRGNSVEDEYPNNQTLSIPQATAHIPLLPRSYGYVPPPPDYNSYHAPDFHYTYQPSDPSYSSPSPPTINSPTPPLLYVSHGIPTPQMNSNVVPVSEMYRQQMYYYENPQLTAQYFLPVSYPQQAAPLPPAHSTMIAPQGPLSLLEKKREHQYGANVHQAGPNYPLNPIRSSPSHRQRYPDQSPFFIPSGPMPTPQVFSGGRNSMRGGHRWHPPHGADATTPSVTVRSPTLEAFRANKTRKWELKDIFGHAVEFSGDQHGSRFIQQKLENATSEDKQTIFDEIVPVNAIQLMKDVFGNYVIQKFFEYGTLSQKSKLAQVMEGRIHILSLQMYGCRVVQKAIEFVLPEEQAIFVKELEPHILECVKDSNGNHVIQKLVECVPPESLGFVKIFKGNIHALATHPYGCRVLQRCLEHFPEETTRPLTEELHVFSPTLMEDQYGNYVMQYILEHGRPNDKTLIVSKLQGRLLVLARHKYASNVCEKALLCTDTETRRRLVEEILTTRPDGVTPITGMMKDQYANYVLQRAMIVAVGDQKETLFNKVIPQVQSMRKHSSVYAKHLTASMCSLWMKYYGTKVIGT